MWKAAVAAVVSFTMGGAAMTVLGTLLGGYAEPAALGLAGIGLMASSQLLNHQLLGVRFFGARSAAVTPAPHPKVGA
ncbi:MAG TPA: hypothetical protein VFF12_13565 [Myxococcaceae bacterium]|nr:hypothetical protein [Myxococcaceae bacterium]